MVVISSDSDSFYNILEIAEFQPGSDSYSFVHFPLPQRKVDSNDDDGDDHHDGNMTLKHSKIN